MSSLRIQNAGSEEELPSLQPAFSFSTFLRGSFKHDRKHNPLHATLQELLKKLVNKVGAKGGLLAYHKSGIQSTIPAGKTDRALHLTSDDREHLKRGNSRMKDTEYIHPIYSNGNMCGIIYLFKGVDTWNPLGKDLVEAYALIAANNIQMQRKRDSLTKYARSLSKKREELEKIREYNQNLLSITTHDLSSPLNAVSGYLDMVNQCFESDKSRQKIQQYYKHIQSGVNDVSDMLKQLNEVIKFKKGFLKLDLVTVDINWIVKDICELLQANAEQKDIELQAIRAEEPVYIKVDIVKFKRIIYNLVSNAIKYTGPGKHIYVHINASGEAVRVHVKDEGIGISEDKLQKIFEPFVKLNKEEQSEYSQGLGLYISSYFVDMMGGEIIVESKSGKGSTFTIFMPRVPIGIPQSKMA